MRAPLAEMGAAASGSLRAVFAISVAVGEIVLLDERSGRSGSGVWILEGEIVPSSSIGNGYSGLSCDPPLIVVASFSLSSCAWMLSPFATTSPALMTVTSGISGSGLEIVICWTALATSSVAKSLKSFVGSIVLSGTASIIGLRSSLSRQTRIVLASL